MRAGDGVVVLGDDKVRAGRAGVGALVEAVIAGDGEARDGRGERVEGAFGEEGGEVGEVVIDLDLSGLNEGRGGGMGFGFRDGR